MTFKEGQCLTILHATKSYEMYIKIKASGPGHWILAFKMLITSDTERATFLRSWPVSKLILKAFSRGQKSPLTGLIFKSTNGMVSSNIYNKQNDLSL